MQKYKSKKADACELVLNQSFELLRLGIDLTSAEQQLKAMYEQEGMDHPGIEEQLYTILALRERFAELEAIHIREIEANCINAQDDSSPVFMATYGGLPQ